jgi:hypothetical protein
LLLRLHERYRRQRCDDRSALADGAGDQVSGKRRRHLRAHCDRSGRLARDRDLLRVASKRGDILAYPEQRGALIEKGIVPGGVIRRLLRQIRVRKETENP